MRKKYKKSHSKHEFQVDYKSKRLESEPESTFNDYNKEKTTSIADKFKTQKSLIEQSVYEIDLKEVRKFEKKKKIHIYTHTYIHTKRLRYSCKSDFFLFSLKVIFSFNIF